jgi:hypothetical protein
MIGLWSVSAAPANFAGTWSLDKSKSEGLQGPMAGVDQMWVVTQDAKTLSLEIKFSGGQREMPSQKRTYNLDGSPTEVQMGGQMPGTATLTAKWKDDGKTLELTSKRNVNIQGNEATITTTEHWELDNGGKTLKVHRKSESPRGTQESKLVLVKQ